MGSTTSKPAPHSSTTGTVAPAESSSSSSPAIVNAKDDASAPLPKPDPDEEPMKRGSGCPMHRADGSYSYDWRAIFRAGFPHTSGGSKPLSEKQVREATSTASIESSTASVVKNDGNKSDNNNSSGGGCPVKHGRSTLTTPLSSSGGGGGGGGCPVKHGTAVANSSSSNPEYNVYSQPLDPTNNMPSNPNQLPAPGQSAHLSTERVSSTIPKGGAATEGSTWTYPSPQMFYNALSRKGKLNDTPEEDIESVVALHNNMNEKTWNKVLEWERTVNGEQSDPPKLLKFLGRPSDLSPKAAFKHYILGHPLPYDRHDWTIERTDGTTVRYVIDYYHDETLASEDASSALPGLQDAAASSSLLVDVRPAADDPVQVYNRAVRMPYARHVDGSATFAPLPMLPTATMQSQVQESVAVWQNIQAAVKGEGSSKENPSSQPETMTEVKAKELAANFSTILSQCRTAQAAVEKCNTEEECARASIDLTLCMAKIVCPLQHGALVERLTTNDDASVEEALGRVSDCVTAKTQQRVEAKKLYPNLFS